MRVILFLICCVLYAPAAHAYVPNLVQQNSLVDITTIADPELAQGFFGSLEGFPHTFEIHATKPFTLSLHLRTPNLPANTNRISSIIIKEQKHGVVDEVARLEGKDASWAVRSDTLTGDAYREGSSFEKELDAGVYRVEVHTPDNTEKYILMVGKRNDMTIGYFTLLGRLMAIQRFNERSVFWVVRSPYVYIPLGVLGCLGYGIWYMRRRRVRAGM